MLILKMANFDTPPPLPSSLPPGFDDPAESDEAFSEGKSKFQSIKNMLESAESMYTPPSSPLTSTSSLTSRSNAQSRILPSALDTLIDKESPKLKHVTLERPRRNVRLPSKGSLQNSSGSIGKSPSSFSAEAEHASFDLPPDPLPSLPPDLDDTPRDPPPNLLPPVNAIDTNVRPDMPYQSYRAIKNTPDDPPSGSFGVYPPDAPPEEPPSVPPDAPPDVPPSVPPDAPPSVPPDAPPEEPPSVPPDAPPDVPPSVPPDAPPGVPPDAPPSVPPDAPPGAPPSVPPGAPPGVPPDAPPGVPPDAPPGVPPDAPPGVPPYIPPYVEGLPEISPAITSINYLKPPESPPEGSLEGPPESPPEGPLQLHFGEPSDRLGPIIIDGQSSTGSSSSFTDYHATDPSGTSKLKKTELLRPLSADTTSRFNPVWSEANENSTSTNHPSTDKSLQKHTMSSMLPKASAAGSMSSFTERLKVLKEKRSQRSPLPSPSSSPTVKSKFQFSSFDSRDWHQNDTSEDVDGVFSEKPPSPHSGSQSPISQSHSVQSSPDLAHLLKGSDPLFGSVKARFRKPSQEENVSSTHSPLVSTSHKITREMEIEKLVLVPNSTGTMEPLTSDDVPPFPPEDVPPFPPEDVPPFPPKDVPPFPPEDVPPFPPEDVPPFPPEDVPPFPPEDVPPFPPEDVPPFPPKDAPPFPLEDVPPFPLEDAPPFPMEDAPPFPLEDAPPLPPEDTHLFPSYDIPPSQPEEGTTDIHDPLHSHHSPVPWSAHASAMSSQEVLNDDSPLMKVKSASDVFDNIKYRDTDIPSGSPLKAAFFQKLDSPRRSNERLSGAFDQLALQGIQLSKEERSSAADIAKEIRKMSKKPTAEGRSSLVDTRNLHGTTKSSATGSLVSTEDPERPSSMAELSDDQSTSPEVEENLLHSTSKAGNEKNFALALYARTEQLADSMRNSDKTRSKSTTVPLENQYDLEPVDPGGFGDRSYSFSSGDVVQHVRVLSESVGSQSPHKVTRVRRQIWRETETPNSSSSFTDLRISDDGAFNVDSSTKTESMENLSSRKPLKRTLSPLTSSFTTSLKSASVTSELKMDEQPPASPPTLPLSQLPFDSSTLLSSEGPPTEPPQGPPTEPPTEPPLGLPTDPPQEPPTEPPQEPPAEPPQEPPQEPPAEPPQEPPTEPPQEPPTEPPQGPAIEFSVNPPLEPSAPASFTEPYGDERMAGSSNLLESVMNKLSTDQSPQLPVEEGIVQCEDFSRLESQLPVFAQEDQNESSKKVSPFKHSGNLRDKLSDSKMSMRSENSSHREWSMISYGLQQPKVNLNEWDSKHVCQWLESVNLAQVINLFNEHKVTGSQLRLLDEGHLKSMGIRSLSLRQRILNETAELLGLSKEALLHNKLSSNSFRKSEVSSDQSSDLQPVSREQSFSKPMGQPYPVDVEVVPIPPKRKPSTEAIKAVKRKLSMKLLKYGDPNALKWNANEVCEWMHMNSLSRFSPLFMEYQIDGSMLLALDYQVFDEMGIKSSEDRELILSKIYDLKNPAPATNEEDLTSLLSTYSGPDYEKAEAAVAALKHLSMFDSDDGPDIAPSPYQFPTVGYQLFSHSSPDVGEVSTQSDDVGYFQDGLQNTTPLETSTTSNHRGISPKIANQLDFTKPRKTTPSEVKQRSRRRSKPEGEWSGEGSVYSHFNRGVKSQSVYSAKSLQQPIGKPGLVKLYMKDLHPGSDGVIYKVIPAGPQNTVEDIIKLALERSNIIDDPTRFYITIESNVISSPQRDLTSDEKPLLIQRRWEPNGQKCFRIKVKPSTELQVTVDVPNLPTGVHSLLVHKLTTCSTVVDVLIRKLSITPSPHRRFCLVQYNRNTKVARVLKANTILLRVQATWGEEPYQFILKEMPLSTSTTIPQSSFESSNKDSVIQELQSQLVELHQEKETLKRQLKETSKQLISKEEIDRLKEEKSKSADQSELPQKSYLQPSLSGAEIYKVFLVESPPGEKGLGVVISNKEGEGCLIMKVTPHCPFSDKVQVGDRLLELNGYDITRAVPSDLRRILKATPGHIHLVVARPSVPDHIDSLDEQDIRALQEECDSLQDSLDAKSKEVLQWKEKYQQLHTVSNFQREQSTGKMKSLEQQVEILENQLSESCLARDQLRHTIEELQKSFEGGSAPESVTELAVYKRKHEVLLSTNAKLEQDIQKMSASLRTIEAERDSLSAFLRKQLVSQLPLDMVGKDKSLKSEQLSASSRDEILQQLKETEEELNRQGSYLEVLLSIIMERDPTMLGMMADVQKKRVSQGWL